MKRLFDLNWHGNNKVGKDTSCVSTVKNLFSYSPINLFTYRKSAFTLAEILITLAIIGVVAAITMPTLIQNHQKRSLEVATQKFYSMMSQAVKQYMADEGVDDLRNTALTESDDNDADAYPYWTGFMNKYFKIIDICDTERYCFAKRYKVFNENSYVENVMSGRYAYILTNGMIIGVLPPDNAVPATITVDVNGEKGPNRFGYDLWSMSLFYDGTLDASYVTPECKQNNICPFGYSNPSEIRQDRYEVYCISGSENYGGCFGHFLENGFKFDY